MYRFVNTLTDAQPWINHFTRAAEHSTSWLPTPENSVVILKGDLRGKGVEDSKNNSKIQVVTPVEQIREQAEASLVKDIRDNSIRVVSNSRKRKKSQASAKQAAAKLTKKTKDIFSKYREKRKNGS